MTVNTPVTVPSGGDWREPQRLNLWQSPSPGSGSWREEANDAGVFLGVSGMVCPGDLYGSQWLVRVLVYHQHWAMTVPPDRTPPSPRDTGGVYPDDESPEFLGPGMPPGRRWRWEGLSGHQPFLGPPLLSDHQRAWARRHERWVRYGNAGRANLNETGVICLMILKGPKYLGLSFLQGTWSLRSHVDNQTHCW